MGNKKQRRAEFFKQHPLCCFCGGAQLATEEDHVPARAMFDERKWPEGYNFPACEACNRKTRQDEKVAAFLSRIKSADDGQHTPAQIKELKKCLAAIHRDYPDAYRSMHPSSNEVRRFLRDHNLSRPPNTALSDVPIVSVGRPEFVTPIRNFGIKLLCALHYKHTGAIVPSHWNIAVRLLTNVQISQGILSEEVFKILTGRPKLQRSNNELEDQFSYVFGIAQEATTSAFICKFRESFYLIGIVTSEKLPSSFDEDPERGAFQGHPFNHCIQLE